MQDTTQVCRTSRNTAEKHAQLHYITIKVPVLEYAVALVLPETDMTDPSNPCRGERKRQWEDMGRSAIFQTLHSLFFHLVN